MNLDVRPWRLASSHKGRAEQKRFVRMKTSLTPPPPEITSHFYTISPKMKLSPSNIIFLFFLPRSSALLRLSSSLSNHPSDALQVRPSQTKAGPHRVLLAAASEICFSISKEKGKKKKGKRLSPAVLRAITSDTLEFPEVCRLQREKAKQTKRTAPSLKRHAASIQNVPSAFSFGCDCGILKSRERVCLPKPIVREQNVQGRLRNH